MTGVCFGGTMLLPFAVWGYGITGAVAVGPWSLRLMKPDQTIAETAGIIRPLLLK